MWMWDTTVKTFLHKSNSNTKPTVNDALSLSNRHKHIYGHLQTYILCATPNLAWHGKE